MRSRGGFSRGPGDTAPVEARAPNLWLLDYREGGTFCVANPATLMLWRPNMEGDTALEIEGAGKKTTVAIVDGANFRKWPTDVMPVQYGVDYRLSGAGLAAPVTVRFAALANAPDTVEGSVDMLMAKGCTPQPMHARWRSCPRIWAGASPMSARVRNAAGFAKSPNFIAANSA